MIYRDLLLQAYQMNYNYYVDLIIKEESIKSPVKTIVSETFDYLKKVAKSGDDLIEQSSIFLHKQFT